MSQQANNEAEITIDANNLGVLWYKSGDIKKTILFTEESLFYDIAKFYYHTTKALK